MGRNHASKFWLATLIVGYILILFISGCGSEYSAIGPPLEGGSKISGGSMLLIAGMPGGSGTSDGTGDVARFNSPRGVVASGHLLFVADQKNHSIRRIDTSTGEVSTMAGYPGVSGVDDGTGINARFNSPEGIDTDGQYLYVADTKNHAIRKIDMAGNVITLAGKRGQAGSSDGTGRNALFRGPTAIVLLGDFLYVADTDNHTIRKVDRRNGDTVTIAGTVGKAGMDDGEGLSAKFHYPLGIATDGRYLYVADTYNHTIRRVDPETGDVITLAGKVTEPGSGDQDYSMIRRLDPNTGGVITVPGKAGEPGYQDGSLAGAQFYYPYGLVVKGSSLFVTDLWNEAIRLIDLSNGAVYTIAGTPPKSGSVDGPIGVGRFYSPADITVSGDYAYVADMNNHTIRRVDIITGEISTIAGKPPSPGTTDATGDQSRFYTPGGIVIDGDALYIADTFNHTIRKMDIGTGEVSTLIGTPGVSGTSDSMESPALFNAPSDVIADKEGEYIYIVDAENNVIRSMNLTSGEVRTLVGYPGKAGLQDGEGTLARFNLYYSSIDDNGNEVKGPYGKGIRIEDSLYIADTGNHAIRKIDIIRTMDGTQIGRVTTLAGDGKAGWTDTGEGADGVARFNKPGDLTTDGTYLYVADTGNHALRRVDPLTGVVTTITGVRGSSGLVDSINGAPLFKSPEGIIWVNGVLYVSDTGNHLLRKVDLMTGEVSFFAGDMSCIEEKETVSGVEVIKLVCTGQPAGDSAYGDSTDGTGKTTAFKGPTGLNSDGTYLYVMDTGSNRIRQVKIESGETKSFSFSKNKGVSLRSPAGGDLTGNLLYVAERGNQIVRVLDITELSGAPLTILGGTVGTAGYRYSRGYAAQFNRPVGIAADGAGNLYVADTANHTIRKVVISTREVTTVAGTPGTAGFMNSEFGYPMFNLPRGICVAGDHLYVADSGNHLVRRVNLTNGYVGLVAGLSNYVTNTGSPGTSDSTGAAAGFKDPRGIASDGTYLYVTDTGNHTIRRILRTTGQVKTIAGMPQEGGYKDGVGFEARFNFPRGITVDGDYLYVADTGNNVFRRVNKYTGEVITFSGKTGQASFTAGEREEARYNNVVSLTTAPHTPYLFFTDSVENAIGKIEK